MYTEHFELDEDPFKAAAGVRFVFGGGGFAAARADFSEALRGGAPLAVLAAAAGLGKTALLRALADDLRGAGLGVAFLQCHRWHTPADLLQAADGAAVLLLDEAQDLADGVLEEALEQAAACRLKVLVAGPPGVEALLLATLPAGIAGDAIVVRRLRPLTPAEVTDFIAERLAAAGSPRADIFAPAAVAAVARLSGGVPRLINRLCATALFLAALEAQPQVGPALVARAAEGIEPALDGIADPVPAAEPEPEQAPELVLEPLPLPAPPPAEGGALVPVIAGPPVVPLPRRSRRGAWLPAAAAVAAVAAVGLWSGLWLLDSKPPPPLAPESVAAVVPVPPAAPAPAAQPSAAPTRPATPAEAKTAAEKAAQPPDGSATVAPPAAPTVSAQAPTGVEQAAEAQDATAAVAPPPSPTVSAQAVAGVVGAGASAKPPALRPAAAAATHTRVAAGTVATGHGLAPVVPARLALLGVAETPPPARAAVALTLPAPQVAALPPVPVSAPPRPTGAVAQPAAATPPAAAAPAFDLDRIAAGLARRAQPQRSAAAPGAEPAPAVPPAAAPAPAAVAPAPVAAVTASAPVPAAPVRAARRIVRPDAPPLTVAHLADPPRLAAALEAGADPSGRFEHGHTALTLAAYMGESGAVRLLLEAGADPNRTSNGGGSPLMYAAWNGDYDSVGALLAAGAQPNVQNVDGKTALMAAASNGHRRVVSLLLRTGAYVDARSFNGWTALMYAVWAEDPAIVEMLVAAGADPAVVNEEGRTAASLAAERRAPGLARRLAALADARER